MRGSQTRTRTSRVQPAAPNHTPQERFLPGHWVLQEGPHLCAAFFCKMQVWAAPQLRPDPELRGWGPRTTCRPASWHLGHFPAWCPHRAAARAASPDRTPFSATSFIHPLHCLSCCSLKAQQFSLTGTCAVCLLPWSSFCVSWSIPQMPFPIESTFGLPPLSLLRNLRLLPLYVSLA